MTDRFVPHKPGLYWLKDGESKQCIVEIAEKMFSLDLVAHYIGNEEQFDVPSAINLTPVTPPDVVADLVKAIEAVATRAENGYELVDSALNKYKKTVTGD